MSRPAVVHVLDYGIGNLLNAVRALQHCGAQVAVVEQAHGLGAALPDRLVLPGVGAFANAMDELRSRGFDDLIHRFAATQRPFLGICVGAQVLMEGSDEHGDHPGLGLIPGRVQAVPVQDARGTALRVPHVGWRALSLTPQRSDWAGTVLETTAVGEPMYFVHSYAPVPLHPQHRLADMHYGGVPLCAAVMHDNVVGCQFHPERSGVAGLAMLRHFLAL